MVQGAKKKPSLPGPDRQQSPRHLGEGGLAWEVEGGGGGWRWEVQGGGGGSKGVELFLFSLQESGQI